MIEHSRLQLLLYLHSLGEVVPLRLKVDVRALFDGIEPFKDNWCPYNPHKKENRRWGLSLTSLDGGMSGEPDLHSLRDYNEIHGTSYAEDQFTTPTPALLANPQLKGMVDDFAPLGRSHLLRMGIDGYFPPHRDTAKLDPKCFRIFASLNSDSDSFDFTVNSIRQKFTPGGLYVINTTLTHSLKSFTDFSHFLIINVPLTVFNVEKVNSWLMDY